MASATDAPKNRAAPPRQVGRWRLMSPLGAGAFGTAWQARDLGGQVAVVKLLEQLPGDEVRALSRVSHPAVVRLLDAGAVPAPYLVMSMAPGVPLGALQTADVDTHRVVAVLAGALAACHHAGIVHGDVKPDNVLYAPLSRRVTLIDFGLAGGRGGTPRYAAPEVLSGEGGGPAADVYSLGMVAWELAHGAPPYAELELLEALDARRQHPPRASEGPGWWRELVQAMLAPDPGARPTAAAVADVFAANGISVPAPTLSDLTLRAASVDVPVPGLADATDAWLDTPGTLAITGPEGAGKSHALQRIRHELHARGMVFVSINPTGRPWAAIEVALSDPALSGRTAPLPDAIDVIARSQSAAKALVGRTDGPLRVVVDDLEELDDGSRRTVEALARLGAGVLVAGTDAPGWVDQVIPLPAMSEPHACALLQGLLGDVDAETLEAEARRRVGGRPRDLVGFALDAVDGGALHYRHGRWVIDSARLEDLPAEGSGRTLEAPATLSTDSRRLGAVIAMMQPTPLRWALEAAGVDPKALEPLQQMGWVRGRRLLSCTTLQIAGALQRSVPSPQPLWARVVACLLEEEPAPTALLGWALAGAQDQATIERLGAATVQAAMERDVRDAAALGSALHELCPTTELLQARIEACVLAGRVDEARSEGEAWLGDRAPRSTDLPILLAMAKLEDAVTEDAAAILGWTTRARTALGNREAPVALDLLEARARFRSGDLELAEQICATRCAHPPDPHEVAEWLHARGLLAQIRAQRVDAADGLRAMDVPEELGRGTSARALFESTRGRLLWMAGRPRQAAAVLQAAAAHRDAISTVDRARMENNAALCWYMSGDVERAVAGWDRALVSFEALGAEVEVLRVQVNLCHGLAALGRWDRAVQAGEIAVQLARSRDVPAFEAVALGNLGDVAMWRRRFRAAEDYYRRAEARFDDGDESSRVELARRRAELGAFRAVASAQEQANEAVRLAEALSLATEHGRSLAVRALLQARAGRRDEARRDAQYAIEVLREADAPGDFAIARLWIAEAMLALQDRELARRHATDVLRYADEFGRAPLRAWANEVLGWCRTRSSDSTAGLEQLTELSVRVARQIHLDGVLDQLAEAAVELVDAERAFVVLLEDEDLRVAARAGDTAEEASPSTSVVRRAIGLGREIVVTDLDNRMDLQRAESVAAMELKAVMCAPLFVDGVAVGALYLDSRQTPMASMTDAVALVRSLAAHASVALGNARLTSQVKGQVLRVREAAHDLRNPLAGVLMMLEDVEEGSEPLTPSDARRAIGDLRHALDLVQSALTAHEPERVAFPWQSAVANWARSLEPLARTNGVQLDVRTDSTEGRALGRPMDLRRAVSNVVGNAIKYTPRGGRVTVTAFVDDVRVGVWIDDEGPGVPEHEVERIFETGVQARGALAGHGLGLAIARRVCEEHGGAISAQRRDVGSRFELWVPRRSG